MVWYLFILCRHSPRELGFNRVCVDQSDLSNYAGTQGEKGQDGLEKWRWMDRKVAIRTGWRNVWQWEKHARPYSDLLQALKGEHLSALVLNRRDLNFCVCSTPLREARNKCCKLPRQQGVSRFGLAVGRQTGKQKVLGSIPLRLSFFFKSCGLWTLSCDFVPHN